MEGIKKKLQEEGFKLTPQRQATVAILLEKEDDHLSAEAIYMLVKRKYPDIGLATVYRTLEILTDLNITYRVVFDDGLARFDLKRDGSNRFHQHLLCNIEEIHENLLGEVEKTVEERFHFKVEDHRLTFHGICQKCREGETHAT